MIGPRHDSIKKVRMDATLVMLERTDKIGVEHTFRNSINTFCDILIFLGDGQLGEIGMAS